MILLDKCPVCSGNSLDKLLECNDFTTSKESSDFSFLQLVKIPNKTRAVIKNFVLIFYVFFTKIINKEILKKKKSCLTN